MDKKEVQWAPSNRARERRDHERTFAQIPDFCALPVKRITPAAKADALDKLGSSARRKATSWIDAVLYLAETGLVRVHNGGADAEVEHHGSMPYAQVPAFYAGLGSDENARALRWTILTGARPTPIGTLSYSSI